MMRVPKLTPHDMESFWTPGIVKSVMVPAFQAVLACPLSKRDLPARVISAWPEVVRSQWEETVENVSRPIRPGQRELEEAYQAVPWLLIIENARDRKVLHAALCGAKWKNIEYLDGRSKEWLSRKVVPGCFDLIARRLNEEKKVTPRGFTKVTNFGT